MAGEIGGTSVFLIANGFSLEVADFQTTRRQAVIDRSSALSAGEPRNASGQRTGQLTASGPRSETTALVAKGVTLGSLVTFRQQITANLWLEIVCRIGEETLTCAHTKGADWSITGEQYGAATPVGL